ncbi:AAA family ATPase [Rhodococcus sp. X156]|uniref:AAA family ATPase n=1 Tax=Rhodococcus sp. X156 TaxID=2499145 RepID=UPI000FD99410|nr:AAA family ATPase [Rhodococcus sp. X156]
MVLYTPFTDLQPRTFARFERHLGELPKDRAAEDHLFLISSRDPAGERKLDSWSQDGSVIGIALPWRGDLPLQIIMMLARRIARRNLYEETLPVTGKAFFGRRQLLTELLEETREGRVFGVFGLRKTGKTSLVKEVGQRFQEGGEQSRIFILRDLETLPSSSPRLGSEFVQDLRQAFLAALRPSRVRTKEITDLSPDASIGELRRAVGASIIDAKRSGIRIVLALDEIEYLIGDSEALSRGGRPEVPEILGALRSLVQENSNFAVILSGITSALIHRGDIYGVENPFYSWAKVFYVPPMSQAEIRTLTVEVGIRMGLRWTEPALLALFRETEGNVFLHRTLAAQVVAGVKIDDFEEPLDTDDVDRARSEWKRSISERIAESYRSTQRHYPTECGLLEMFARGDATKEELLGIYPREVNRLIELNLLVGPVPNRMELGIVARLLREGGSI